MKPEYRDITLRVTGVTEANRHEKFARSVDQLSKALRVPMTIKPRSNDKGLEKFPFRAYEDLAEKWTRYMGVVLDRLYLGVSKHFGLPRVTTFSKAIDPEDDSPLTFRGTIVFSPETGQPITRKEWKGIVQTIERFLNRAMSDVERQVVLDSVALGKVLDRMVKYNTYEAVQQMRLDDIRYRTHSFDWLSDSTQRVRDTFGLTDSEAARIEVAQDALGERITGIKGNTRAAIRNTFLDGIKNREPKVKVAQRLFDRFGGINRDWQRVVETEVNDNMNTAMLYEELAGAEDGKPVYLRRIEIMDSHTCAFCAKASKRDVIAKLVPEPLPDDAIEDPHASIAVWPGKTNSGRDRSEWWWPSGPVHPWCRGSWERWIPPTPQTDEIDDLIAGGLNALNADGDAWGQALAQAEREFQDKGVKRPHDGTPGYLDRINELYEQIKRGGA